MSFGEAAVFVEEWSNKEKESWERQRLGMWANFQPFCSESIEPGDLFTLPWEDKEDEHEATEDEIKEAFAFAKTIQNKMFEKK